HFTSSSYISLLQEHPSISISMDSKGRALDNIRIERFWRSLKYEEVYLKDYNTPREARNNIRAYMELYNHERPHQSLNYQTPGFVYFQYALIISIFCLLSFLCIKPSRLNTQLAIPIFNKYTL